MNTRQLAILHASPNKFSTSHRKDGKCWFSSMQVISLAATPNPDGTVDAAATLHLLYGTGARHTACLWVSHAGDYRRGSGSAGGCGYHRKSAAAAEAFRNAGVELSQDIDGRGEEAMREAMMALAAALGVERPALVESYS